MTTSRKDAREALRHGIEEDGFVLIEEHLSVRRHRFGNYGRVWICDVAT